MNKPVNFNKIDKFPIYFVDEFEPVTISVADNSNLFDLKNMNATRLWVYYGNDRGRVMKGEKEGFKYQIGITILWDSMNIQARLVKIGDGIKGIEIYNGTLKTGDVLIMLEFIKIIRIIVYPYIGKLRPDKKV